MLLLQILIILLAARLMGWVFRKMRQPAVIGEIVAGILLGPSLFGHVSPELFGALFPTESLPNIQLLTQLWADSLYVCHRYGAPLRGYPPSAQE